MMVCVRPVVGAACRRNLGHRSALCARVPREGAKWAGQRQPRNGVVDALKQRIESGALPAERPLSSEVALAEECDVAPERTRMAWVKVSLTCVVARPGSYGVVAHALLTRSTGWGGIA